ncbi:MAG: AAA family ATPase [Gudongella sp.]|nr:AAA family ATPase [Gudongella sp.]
MIITKLELNSFGKFKNYELELKDGLNLLYGENESGKSTIHSFIEGIFYSFLKPFTKKTIYSEKHEKYSPLESNLYRGNLEFKIDNVMYRIEKDFKKNDENTRIYEKSTGEDITHKASELSVGKVVQPGIYFFGLSYLVFKNTVFVSQQGVYTDDKLADEVRDRLVNVVTTKDENISVNKAIDILDLEFKEIGTERAYTSKYGLLIKELTHKKMELKEVEQKRISYNEWIENAEVINNKRKKLKIEISKKEEMLKQIDLSKKLKRYNEALDLEKAIKILTEEISSLDQYKSVVVEDFSKAEYLNYDIKKLSSQIEDTKSEIANIEFEKNSIDISKEPEVKELENIIEDGLKLRYIEGKSGNESISVVESKIKRHEKSIKNIKLVASAVSVLYIFLSFYFIFIKNYILFTAIQSILLVLILLFYKLKLHRDSIKPLNNNQNYSEDIFHIIRKYDLDSIEDFYAKLEYTKNKKDEINNKKTNLIKLDARIATAIDKLRKLESSLIVNKKDLDVILEINCQNSIEGFKKSKSKKLRFDELQKELENGNKELNKLLDGKTIEDLEVDKEQIKNVELDLVDLDEEQIFNDLNILRIDLENLSLDYKEFEVQIQNLEGQISKEASLSENILGLEAKKEYLDKKKNSIQYAINRIKELSTDIHRDYAPIINKKVGELVNRITDGRYISVKIDKNLNVSVESKDGNKLLNLNNLSAGTIDQIYFSLRMGLAEEVTHNNLPLILDECFSQYDDLRLSTILKFLVEKNQKRQIVLFTCHNREKKILDSLGIKYNYINLQN